MAYAKPCIVSDVIGSGMPWVINASDAGRVVPVHGISEWRAAVTQLQHDSALRLCLGLKGQRALQSKFCIDLTAREIKAEYLHVVSETPNERANDQVLIVIPAKDEALTIGALISSLRAVGWRHILVVDDQSRDHTGEIAASAGAQVLAPVLSLGAWGAMQAGIRYGLAKGYGAVVTMDADGQHEVEELPVLLKVRESADVIIGAFPARASVARRVAWFWFRALAGFNLLDLTSGFRLYNRKAMKVLASEEATLLDYQDVGTLLMLRKAGLTAMEVSVSMNTRISGKSRIFSSWLNVARYMAMTTLLCLSQWSVKSLRA